MIFAIFFLGGRWFSKLLRNIWGWYIKILTIPYRGGWVVWKRLKTPLRNIKMAPKQTTTEILDLRDSLASQYKSYSPGAIREEPFFLQKTCRLLFLFTLCCRFTYTLLFLLWDHPFNVFYYHISRTYKCTRAFWGVCL